METFLLVSLFLAGSACSQRIITPPSPTFGLVDAYDAKFSCEIEKTESDFIEWYFGNKLIYCRLNGEEFYPTWGYSVEHEGSVSTLTIERRLTQTVGESPYGCKVLGRDPAYAELVVMDKAIRYFGADSSTRVKSETVEFTCQVNETVIDFTELLFGNTVIYQHRNGEGSYPIGDSKYSVVLDEARSEFKLTVNNLTVADADFPYQCRVVTSDFVGILESAEKTLTVLESGMITPPSPTSGVIGGKAHFSCEIGMSGSEYMEWLFGTTVVYYFINGVESYPTGGTKYSVIREGSVFTLTVDDLTLADGDFPYGCKILLEDPAQASLTVRESGIITGPSPAVGAVGGSAKFTCEIDPVPSEYIQWRFGETVIYKHYVNGKDQYPKEDDKYVVQVDGAKFMLSVRNLTFEDAVLPYVCEVQLGDPAEAKLDVVEYAGKILQPPNNRTGLIGGSAQFTCQTDWDASRNYMEWRFGNTVIYYYLNRNHYYPVGNSKYTVSENRESFYLTVRNLEKSDEAFPYSCNVLETPPAEALLTITGETFEILYDGSSGMRSVAFVGNSSTLASLSILPDEVKSAIISGNPMPASKDVNVDLTHTVFQLDNFKRISYGLNNNDPDTQLLRMKHVEMLEKEGWQIIHQEFFHPKVFMQLKKI